MAMTTVKHARRQSLAHIDAAIAAARAGNRDVTRKVIARGPAHEALVERARNERAALIADCSNAFQPYCGR
jgi:hypothetical protein